MRVRDLVIGVVIGLALVVISHEGNGKAGKVPVHHEAQATPSGPAERKASTPTVGPSARPVPSTAPAMPAPGSGGAGDRWLILLASLGAVGLSAAAVTVTVRGLRRAS
jgi:hypothetical protein